MLLQLLYETACVCNTVYYEVIGALCIFQKNLGSNYFIDIRDSVVEVMLLFLLALLLFTCG